MYKLYNRYYTTLRNKGRYRVIPSINYLSSFIDFSTNDYLCFSKLNILCKEVSLFMKRYGIGSTGSRLISGNRRIFEKLEFQIAKDKKTESSLIFNSGFQANISVLSSLLNRSVLKNVPIVFFDRLNHASLYQAVFLSKARLIRYRHNDMEHLNDLLKKYNNWTNSKFIVTETVFGMDGDILLIKEIFFLTKKYNAFLYLDEAHATGIIGDKGYGLSSMIDLSEIPHLVLGTFSKAIGCFGAYIACSEVIKNYLINCCPGFIYSTSLPPMLIGAVFKAWKLIKDLSDKRFILHKKSNFLREKLNYFGFNTGNSSTNIIPIFLNKNISVINVKNMLLQKKIIVSAIRPPTVPPGSSRLRIAVNISHSDEQINSLLEAIKVI
ncbi:8-amino-7-oxononanoate synthase [Candidatus Legionella polyplacis]|uniref:aminotransferase class I/II-fold pyridoxal phosphate-dependent enzyme n=1 Tax=Candidatus Legionella polyplacis TaxID=2005262 RepID=UPI000C1E9DB8|nr:pyridoxal phosphate-dependent aminotransferase family protein [Candidatus Legionella polyplacis]ATW01822.1 8-amino-7-oxononanoate synthase [Candidatus Legionella polyplacis]